MRHTWTGRLRQRITPATGALIVALTIFAGCATGAASSSPPPTAIAGTPTRAQMLTSIAQAAAGAVPVSVALATDASTSLVTMTATLAGDVPRTPGQIQASQERVKAVTFVLQRALWTDGTAQPSEVKVNVLGPLLDDYFDRITDWYGGAQMAAKTEAKLAWETLTSDSAWSAYDIVWLRPYYAPFQQWGAPSPSQP